jgi:uncharacterized damage-inducible protein DinB
MKLVPMLRKEMEQEAITTRKMLSIVPNDQFDWKPHEKSMTIRQLATHVAELPGWISMVLQTEELDFAKTPYSPVKIDTTSELVTYFEKTVDEGLAGLSGAKEEDLLPDWVLRQGDMIFSKSTKLEMIRSCYCQVVHHRAQLGVYLRLLNIPIPGSYGPSADGQ